MHTQIQEATRLTREGRLAEAMSLIQQNLGIKPPPAGGVQSAAGTSGLLDAEFRVVEPVEKGDPPASASADVNVTATVDTKPRPAMRPAGKGKLRGAAGVPKRFLKARLKTGLKPRRVPLEAIAPPSGRWIEGIHSELHGSRAYKLYVPGNCDGRPLPLIVMLHGCTQEPDDFAAGTRMNFVAESSELLVVYPAQDGTANLNRCWNWFQPADQQRDSGEPALIAGITRQIMAERKVDPSRVYVAGLSAGGAMAAVMAAEYPDLYAAVGVHSAPVPGGAHDLPSAFQVMQGAGSGAGRLAAPVPLILFHGDQDHTVNPANAEQLVQGWAPAAGDPRVEMSHDASGRGRAYTRAIYEGADGQVRVERWTVHGAGHAWSGGSRNGSFTDPDGPDASRELVRFFLEYPRGGE